ncbi:MAG: PIG-L deacetylase family protein [Christensenellales bacterium]
MEKVKSLAIGAHPDDAEIFAMSAIANKGFALIVLSDGAGCCRGEGIENLTSQELIALREKEQAEAAKAGGYLCHYMLGYSSEQVRKGGGEIEEKIAEIIDVLKPENVYVHNPFDSHPTHIGAFWRAFNSLKKAEFKPNKLYACEVWRGLDWFEGKEKVILSTDGTDEISDAVLSKFTSQNATKAYNVGAKGRRYANATFSGSHERNTVNSFNWALDLTEYLYCDETEFKNFLIKKLEDFKSKVLEDIFRYG